MASSQLKILEKVEKSKNDKKNRLVVLVVLLITVIPSIAFWLVTRIKTKQIDFSLSNPFAKIDVSQIKLPEIDPVSTEAGKFGRWYSANMVELPGQWAIKVELLDESFSWGSNQNSPFMAASLIKLPIVAAFYHQVESGVLQEKTVYVLADSDKKNGAGSLQYQEAGVEFTLSELATLSLSQSDNTAAYVLQKIIGSGEIQRLIGLWGMEDTILAENLTSAEDIAIFFRKLYQGQLVGQEYQQKMLADLTETSFEDRIPAGVPKGVTVAHKVGSEQGVVSDAGIVFTPDKPFILVILSQETNVGFAQEKFSDLVGDLYWLVVND